MKCAPRSSGRARLNDPRNDLASAVRELATMTASLITSPISPAQPRPVPYRNRQTGFSLPLSAESALPRLPTHKCSVRRSLRRKSAAAEFLPPRSTSAPAQSLRERELGFNRWRKHRAFVLRLSSLPGRCFDSNAVFPQEIKVAAELRAENGIRIEFGISSPRPLLWLHLAPPVFEILLGNHNIDAPFFYAQPNLIASPNQSQRSTYRRLWGDMQNDGSERSAAHACIGDAHHVFDASTRQLRWNGQVSGLGHTGSHRSRIL